MKKLVKQVLFFVSAILFFVYIPDSNADSTIALPDLYKNKNLYHGSVMYCDSLIDAVRISRKMEEGIVEGYKEFEIVNKRLKEVELPQCAIWTGYIYPLSAPNKKKVNNGESILVLKVQLIKFITVFDWFRNLATTYVSKRRLCFIIKEKGAVFKPVDTSGAMIRIKINST